MFPIYSRLHKLDSITSHNLDNVEVLTAFNISEGVKIMANINQLFKSFEGLHWAHFKVFRTNHLHLHDRPVT